MRRMETRNPSLRGARLSAAVLAFSSLFFAAACSEPCLSEKAVPMARDSTPFKDGRSVFSICDRCPVLEGHPSAGPATGCSITFDDNADQAFVTCLYGPGGNTTSSAANDAILDTPNEFEFCEQHCPDEAALHGCKIRGFADSVDPLECFYGQRCYD